MISKVIQTAMLPVMMTMIVPAVSQVAYAASWEIDLAPDNWTRPESQMADSAVTTANGLTFRMRNTPQEPTTLSWTYKAGGQKLEEYQYCLITYRADGISRGLNPASVPSVVSVVGPDKEGKSTSFPVLDISKAWLDNKEHTILIRKPLPVSAESIRVDLTSDGTGARVDLKRVVFLKDLPSRVGDFDMRNGWNVAGFETSAFKSISLDNLFNDSVKEAFIRQVSKDGASYGGALNVPTGRAMIQGVPFSLGAEGKNLVKAAQVGNEKHEDKVMVFGEMATRRQFMRPGRNDFIDVPVNARGSELYLLLQSESPTTYSTGVTPIPYHVPDIESFAVHLVYADGETDLAFPWSVQDKAFTIRNMLGAYAVPLDSKRVLKSVRLLNREWDKYVSLAGVTVNTSTRPLFPAAWKAPAAVKVAPLVKLPARQLFARRSGNVVTLGNTYYEVTADFSDGFTLKNLRNRSNSNATINLDPTSGLELTLGSRVITVAGKPVNVGGKVLTGKDFKVTDIKLEGASVVAQLQAKDTDSPLGIRVRLTATNNEELQTNCSLTYNGSSRTTLKFPLLKEMSIGSVPDTWYFFPHCGNALTNQRGWYQSYNNQGFAVQFINAFNSSAGIGVGLMTRNVSPALYAFGSNKNEAGVTQYIKYDTEHGATDHLKAKLTGMTAVDSTENAHIEVKASPLKTVTTSLVFHAGDWRGGARVYKNWLDTWYKPIKSQKNKQWNDSWLIGCLWASDKISRADVKVAPFYDPKTGKFHIDEAVAADTKYLGSKPDGYHYFKLVHDDQRNYNLWNETAEGTYPRIGGLANGQQMVKDFHDRDMFVSLYYIPDRYGLFSELAKKYDRSQIGASDKAGNYLIWDGYFSNSRDTIEACSENETWHNYLAQNTNKIVRDLKIDSIYLDVFPMHRASCYNPDHGHALPSNPNQGSFNLVKKLRDLYPANTPIWTEYQPPDVISQYLDGYLSYSATSTALILSPRWDVPEETPNLLKPEIDLARYLMPQLKQFCLPQGYGTGWNVMKHMLFNGKGLFGGGWGVWDSDVSSILREQTRLLRKYTDCFMSDKPEHLVSTLRGDVYANKFPAKNRTLWTVMNGAGVTVRGEVIAVPHVANASYQNAANGKPLQYQVRGGMAYISMKLDPQSVSCILQTPAVKK